MLYKIVFDIDGVITTFFCEGNTISDAIITLNFSDKQMKGLLSWERVEVDFLPVSKEQFLAVYKNLSKEDVTSSTTKNGENTLKVLYKNFSELPLYQQYYLMYLYTKPEKDQKNV